MLVRVQEQHRPPVTADDVREHPRVEVLRSDTPKGREVFRVVVVLIVVRVREGLLPQIHAQEVDLGSHLRDVLVDFPWVQFWRFVGLSHMFSVWRKWRISLLEAHVLVRPIRIGGRSH